jgi:hypothetical protein
MEDNKYNRKYSKESVGALLSKLRLIKTTGYDMNLAWIKGLIAHLSERELSEKEQTQFQHIVTSDVDVIRQEDGGTIYRSSVKEKYSTLRTISGVFIVFAVIVGLVSLVGAISYFDQGEAGTIIALYTIVGGAVTVLLLVAGSAVIDLLLDIEHNTRKAAER